MHPPISDAALRPLVERARHSVPAPTATVMDSCPPLEGAQPQEPAQRDAAPTGLTAGGPREGSGATAKPSAVLRVLRPSHSVASPAFLCGAEEWSFHLQARATARGEGRDEGPHPLQTRREPPVESEALPPLQEGRGGGVRPPGSYISSESFTCFSLCSRLWRPQSLVTPFGSLSVQHLPPARGPQSQGEIHGNRKSKMYHLPSCPNYDRLKPANMVPFASETEATAGYRKARNCR